MCYLLLFYHFLIKTGLSMSGQWGFRQETNQKSDESEGQIDTVSEFMNLVFILEQ